MARRAPEISSTKFLRTVEKTSGVTAGGTFLATTVDANFFHKELTLSAGDPVMDTLGGLFLFSTTAYLASSILRLKAENKHVSAARWIGLASFAAADIFLLSHLVGK